MLILLVRVLSTHVKFLIVPREIFFRNVKNHKDKSRCDFLFYGGDSRRFLAQRSRAGVRGFPLPHDFALAQSRVCYVMLAFLLTGKSGSFSESGYNIALIFYFC